MDGPACDGAISTRQRLRRPPERQPFLWRTFTVYDDKVSWHDASLYDWLPLRIIDYH